METLEELLIFYGIGVAVFAIFIGILDGYYTKKEFSVIDYIEAVFWPIFMLFVYGYLIGSYANDIKNYLAMRFSKK